MRPGDNLFSVSIVAVEAHTGKYRWHFQQVHHDISDYDSPNPVVLFDAPVNGVTRKALVEVSKTGWAYILDRATGKPLLGIEMCARDRINSFCVQAELPPKVAPNDVYMGGRFVQAAGGDRGILAALDLTTNKLAWRQAWRAGAQRGDGGHGGGPTLVNGLQTDAIVAVANTGRNNMPPFGRVYTDADLRDVATYITTVLAK